jgi:hypothetical protein
MRVQADPDLILVDAMRAPPALEDARSSLEYWERRQRALPVYRRGARREAREMAARWEARLRAAERVRFESTLTGRILVWLGLSRFFVRPAGLMQWRLISFAWLLVPRRMKLVAGAVLAAWVIVAIATFTVVAAVLAQLT